MNFEQTTLESEQLIDGRYRYVRDLGEGATGTVILVKDTMLGDKLLALKILLPNLLNDETSIIRFRSETRVTMSLSHPNIAQTFGMGRHENSFYYLKMEYCRGQDLRSLIEKHPTGLPIEQAVTILRDIAAALEYAHSRGVIHRDLKPENVLITEGPQAHLLDFGLAQSFQDDTRVTAVGSVLGTPNYMSPEQLQSELIDSRSDIYSFGIIAYELLNGSRPFKGESLFELAEAHLHQELPPLKDSRSPDWLISIVEHCCQKKSVKRPDDISEVLLMLEQHATRKMAPILQSCITARTTDSTIFETQSQNRNIILRKMAAAFRIFVFWMVPGAIFLAPHVHPSARWRYICFVAVAEKHIGRQVPLLRLLSNAPPDLNYPASAFGPSESRKQEIRELGYDRSDELDGRKYYRPYLRAGYSPDYLDPTRGTYPLHFYTRSSRARIVKEFLEYGADPHLIDSFGFTAVDYATRHNVHEARSLATLLEHGADPTIHSKGNQPPLVKIINQSHIGGLKAMLKSPLNNPDIKDKDGNPAIFAAIASGNPQILELMIQYDADVRARDTSGRDVLEFARSLPFLPERDEIEGILRKELRKSAPRRDSPKSDVLVTLPSTL